MTREAPQAARHSQPGAEGGWQPIETAPKDGTDVLIWNCEGAEIAHWAPKEEDGPDQPGYDEGWHGSYAWPGRSWGNRLQSFPQGQPTHWMPLPAAPDAALDDTQPGIFACENEHKAPPQQPATSTDEKVES